MPRSITILILFTLAVALIACDASSLTPTATPAGTATDTPTSTATFTSTPTFTPSPTFTPTLSPTITLTPTALDFSLLDENVREQHRVVQMLFNAYWPRDVCQWWQVRCDNSGNIIRLDACGLGLTTLSPEIGTLTSLEALNLSCNHLTELPPEVGGLASLQSLDLSYNDLTTLPPEIGQLANLEVLNLAQNTSFSTLPPEIGQLTNCWC